jgi:hypothetical protein
MKHMTKTDNQNLNKLGYQTATSRLFNLTHSPDYTIYISGNKHIVIHLLVYRNVGLVSRGRSTCACGVSCVEEKERTHSHRLAAVRVRGDTAGAAVRRRWERALTWPDKRGPGGRELVAEKRRAPAPPRGVAGRIVLASSRVVRACRAHVARGARRGRGHGHGEARQHRQGICCTARVYILVHVMWVPPGASIGWSWTQRPLPGHDFDPPPLEALCRPLTVTLCQLCVPRFRPTAAEGRKMDGWMDPACRDVCNLLCVADVQQGCIVCDEFDRLTHVAKTKRRRRGRSATCTSFSRIWTDKSFFSPPFHEQRLFALICAKL